MAKKVPVKLPPRERIVRATMELMRSGGLAAVSTRAVSEAAGVQAPAIYRQFGDMNGLFEAAAREVLAEYVRGKAARVASDDPLEDLRRGWDEHIAFGLANPSAYGILYGRVDPDDPDGRAGYGILERLVGRLAEAGRLRVSVASAAGLIHAAGKGVTLSLIALPEERRDPTLSELMREAVLAAIMPSAPAAKTSRSGERVAARAVALRAVLDEAPPILSTGEQHLFVELLDKLATSAPKAAPPLRRDQERARR